MAEQSLSPVHISSVSTGKNAADLSLTIDAMDLMYARRVDAFVIVSSDPDYTRLAIRVRGGGYAVHAYDAAHAPSHFQPDCSSFLHLEDLATGAALAAERAGKWKLSPSDAEANLVLAALHLGGGSECRGAIQARRLPPPA